MRWLSVSALQAHIGREFKELPFGVTLYGKKWARVEPLRIEYNDEKPVTEMKTGEILKEILGLGVSYYRDNPDKITPGILLKAAQIMEGMEKQSEYEKALFDASGELFEDKEEDPLKEDGQTGTPILEEKVKGGKE